MRTKKVFIPETIFRGTPAAGGYAEGVAVHLPSSDGTPEKNRPYISEEFETDSFHRALEGLASHFRILREKAIDSDDKLTAELMDAYCEMACDEELTGDIVALVRNERLSAPEATRRVFDEIIEDMKSIEDEYARQRADDLRSVRDRLFQTLSGQAPGHSVELPEEDIVLFGDDLSPADTAQIPKRRLSGLVSRAGGVTSHVVILARSLDIPAVVGVDFDWPEREQTRVFLDGFEGRVVFNPCRRTREYYERKTAECRDIRRRLEGLRDLPAVTRSGRRLRLTANIGHVDEAVSALQSGAEGIGLFRTEFLFMSCERPPCEKEQYRAYREVLLALGERSVTVRTLDVGGDKPLSYLDLPREANPFLGRRGCRIYEHDPELVLSQLCAIYRASIHGNVRILFPMVNDGRDRDRCFRLAEEARNRLAGQKIPFCQEVPLGVMIETPAAALTIEDWADGVDFFSLGTNDLAQYTLAVDRGNEDVASNDDMRHPAVLRLIRETAQAGKNKGKPVSLCGELASEPSMASFFLEIGIQSLSMSPASIPSVKETVRELD